jgi:hypothetical protein
MDDGWRLGGHSFTDIEQRARKRKAARGAAAVLP